MDYSDLPRRPRYSAPPQYEADYAQYDEYAPREQTGTGYGNGNSYTDRRFAGLTGTGAQQRAPWDDEPLPVTNAPTQTFAPTGGFPRAGRFPPTDEFAPTGGLSSNGGFPSSDAFESTGAFSSTGTFYAVDEQDREYAPRPMSRRASNRQGDGGLLAGAVTGFLGAAVAFGVANLIAAFVRPQASPTITIGDAFITHMPSALKHFALAKSGENHRDMLLLGMYVVIALLAMAIGMVAWRQAWACVAAGGLFALFGAYVAINRPESHTTDAIPSLVGGIVAIAVTTWLIGAGAQRARRESPLYETDHYISPSYRTGGTV